MAIELAELAVGAIKTLLASDLETELTAIDTARGGTIVTKGHATTYYQYPRAVLGGGQTHIEIFEGAIDFLNPYSDAAAQRAAYNIQISVRLTLLNRDQDSEADFVTRTRRMGVGVFNVFNKKPTLAGAEVSIQVVTTGLVEPDWITDEESGDIQKSTTTLTLDVRCEEV